MKQRPSIDASLSLRRRRKLRAAVILLLLAAAGAALVLPSVVERRLRAALDKAGYPEAEFRIDGLSLTRLDAHNLRLSKDVESPRIASLRAEFRLDELLRGNAGSLFIQDLSLHLHEHEGSMRIPGLTPLAVAETEADDGRTAVSPAVPAGAGAMRFDLLDIASARIALHLREADMVIPASLQCRYSRAFDDYSISAGASLLGGELDLQGTLDPRLRNGHVALRGEDVSLNELLGLFGNWDLLRTASRVDFHAALALRDGKPVDGTLTADLASLAFASFTTTATRVALRLSDTDGIAGSIGDFSAGREFGARIEQTEVRMPWPPAATGSPVRLTAEVAIPAGNGATNRLALSLTGGRDAEREDAIAAIATVKGHSLRIGDQVRIGELRAELPFALPAVDNGPGGSFALHGVSVGTHAGEATGTLMAAPDGITLGGSVTDLTMGVSAGMTGFVSFATAERPTWIDFVTPTIDLSALRGIEALTAPLVIKELSGSVQASASFSRSEGPVISGGSLFADGVTLRCSKPDMDIENVRGVVRLGSLEFPSSQPGQFLKFSRLRIGSVVFEDGRLLFGVESRNSLFAESFETRWCGGELHFLATRFDPHAMNISTFAYVQDIDIVRLLRELLEIDVAGTGAVSGQMEIKLMGGKLVHLKGEMHTIPGERGNLLFTDASAVAGGTDLVEEAMKDFGYRWVRLDFDTTEGKLFGRLRLQGVPNRELPLRPETRTGQFIRDLTGKHLAKIRDDITLDIHLPPTPLSVLNRRWSK